MKINYYSEDIATALLALDNFDYMESKALYKELEQGLYWLMNTCKNEYNQDYFRVLYLILENITENYQRGIVKYEKV